MTSDEAATARILTLVFTDLADSTALKTERGDQAVGELIARHRAHVRRLADDTGGRIIDWAGDGCFLTFESSSAAVLFALRLQRAHGDEPDLPGVRTGIHMGEVTERPGPEGDAAHPRVEGLAVDLAARITGLARPGQVLMSAAVSDSSQSRLGPNALDQPILWRVHGTYTLKGFDKALEITEVGLEGIAPLEAPTASEKATPIAPAAAKGTARAPRARTRAKTAVVLAVGVVLVTAGGLWLSWPAPLGLLLDIAGLSRLPANPPLPDKPSIVVLPFVNLSGDPDQEYLAEGITEDVTADLGQFKWVFVISRSSAYTYTGTTASVTEVSRQLGVRYLVEGSARKVGDRVRVTAQLTDGTSGVQVWSESYDRQLTDLLDLQAEISERILGALGVEVQQAESVRLRRKPTESLSAYEAFIRGTMQLRRFTRDSVAAARLLFQRAIDADPEFAGAYATLAVCYTTDRALRCPRDEADLSRARAAAERAFALDPFEPMAHVALSTLAVIEGRGPEALAPAKRAVELVPNLDLAHTSLGYALLVNGRRLEAIAAFRQALRLSPRPSAPFIGLLGFASYGAGRPEQAVDFFEQCRAANPDVIPIRVMLAAHYEATGDHEKARTIAQEVLRGNPGCTAEDAVANLLGLAATPEVSTLRQAGFPEREKARAVDS